MIKIKTILTILTGILLWHNSLCLSAQKNYLQKKPSAFFDSLEIRIAELQQQIPRLKQSHDVSLFHVQRELDHSLFIKAYEEYVVDEELFKAKDMVEERIERARLRKDQYSVDFYNGYKDRIYTQIKYQRMYYQKLFEKEKNFKKEFNDLVSDGSVESYLRAQRMTDLAIKYAQENNFSGTAMVLKNYRNLTEAKIFDLNSPYDLEKLTQNQNEFEKLFEQLTESDSINLIKEAEQLADECIHYSTLMKTPLKPDYFQQQKMSAAAALSDLIDKQDKGLDLNALTDQAVVAKLDDINPAGVYKWHDKIIVINEFEPTSGFESVKRGEAIIHADKVLANYLKKNKLCKSVEELKFGYSYIIPYKSINKNSSFIYHPGLQKWQYIACYTLINNPKYTHEVSRFMPPLVFENEEELSNISEK